jgi:hypothetical protein
LDYFLLETPKPNIRIKPIIIIVGRRRNPKKLDSIPTMNEAIIANIRIMLSQILKSLCIRFIK